MEILRIPRPENVMQEIEQITYYPKEKEPLKVETLKSFIIPGIEKKIIMEVEVRDRIKIDAKEKAPLEEEVGLQLFLVWKNIIKD